MRVVFMGSPEFAVLPLEYLVLNGYRIPAVYAQPDRPAGRGRALSPSPVKRAAERLNLLVVQPDSLQKMEVVSGLASLRPDIIVVAAFGQILPRSVLDIPHWGCINLHPSLLPGFRGASPVASAILAGAEFTGVSIMLMDEGVDTGPILARAQIPISGRDTTGSLTAKLSRISAQLLLSVLPSWVKGTLSPQPQDAVGASYCRPISKNDGEIDWRLSAVDIWRRVRAFHPWPGCYTRWRGRRMRIIEAAPVYDVSDVAAGLVVALPSAGEAGGEPAFGVGTGDAVLGVLRVQMEGRRAISAAEFLKGQRELVGARLPLN
ncbi:MAG: methionyl-tRNA formyltransferase [Dehalococcoidales bacterium]|nr:methionyl-tRNA formyltransferase [Dehalococcoidales bacterium]